MLFGTNQRKPMGLFGGFAPSGMQQMPQADPMAAMGQSMGQVPMMQQGQQFAQSQAPKKPGINWLGVLADTLAGAAGREGPYAASMRAKAEQEALQEHARQQREASMQDWRTKFEYANEYERNNPKPHQPDDFERSLMASGVQPGTEEWANANRQRLQNFTDPIVNVNLPGGAIYSGPRSGLQAALGRSSGGNADSTPTTEDGHSYTPGPGGRANPQNWKPVGGASGNAGPRFPVTGKATGFTSYKSASYNPLEEAAGKEFGVPPGVLTTLRTRGERSNANQVSEVGARSVYQITPETRQLIIKKYKFDPWASPQDSARGAAIVARDMYRKFGNWNDAMTGYHGGNDTRNWGSRTRAYRQRTNK